MVHNPQNIDSLQSTQTPFTHGYRFSPVKYILCRDYIHNIVIILPLPNHSSPLRLVHVIPNLLLQQDAVHTRLEQRKDQTRLALEAAQ
jgi:hypothetical protein